jgi:hypothetical protein
MHRTFENSDERILVAKDSGAKGEDVWVRERYPRIVEV